MTTEQITIQRVAQDGDTAAKDINDYKRKGLPVPEPIPIKRPAITDWMGNFELSQAEVDEMMDAEFLIPDLVIRGQVNIIAAKGGCGKTSILMEELIPVAARGMNILYVNMDCSGADVKYWKRKANEAPFRMINPHFKGSRGIKEWMAGMEAMLNMEGDLSNTVIVVDTLKKIADLMNKSAVKHAMGVFRGLSARQTTIICPAHCNKSLDPAGKLVFEGVGDIESDCDNLVYLQGSEKDGMGDKVVTAVPSDKVRGVFHKRTWKLYQDRRVERLNDVIDVAGAAREAAWLKDDATVIEALTKGITNGLHTRVDLNKYAMDNSISQRRFDKVLNRYTKGWKGGVSPLWENQRQFSNNNASYYILIEQNVRSL